MYNKIKDIMEIYNSNGKIADSSFIKNIILIVREDRKLENYLTKLNYYDGNIKESIFIEYNVDEKQISIDIPNLIDIIELNTSFITNNLNKKDKVSFINLHILFYLLHELEHVGQIKNYNEINHSYIENRLFHISDHFSPIEFKYNSKLQKKYDKYLSRFQDLYYNSSYFHDITPIERMADIKACKDVLALANMMNVNDAIIDYFKYCLLNMECVNYIENDECSLKTFFDIKQYIADKCGLYVRDKSNRELLDIDYLSDEYKLLYGLPVLEQEIERRKEQLKNTKTYRLINKAVTK